MYYVFPKTKWLNSVLLCFFNYIYNDNVHQQAMAVTFSGHRKKTGPDISACREINQRKWHRWHALDFIGGEMRVLLFSSTWMWMLFPRLFPYKHAGRQQHTHDDINRLLVEGASTGPGASESGRPFTGERWFLIWLLNCRTGGNLHTFPVCVCVCMKKWGVEEAVIIGGRKKRQ